VLNRLLASRYVHRPGRKSGRHQTDSERPLSYYDQRQTIY
jgi:hypothetical protein